jgi:hypothetical protein
MTYKEEYLRIECKSTSREDLEAIYNNNGNICILSKEEDIGCFFIELTIQDLEEILTFARQQEENQIK